MSTVLYKKANLQNAGLSLEALEAAVKGYEKLVEEGTITNSKYLAIVDLSQSSRKKKILPVGYRDTGIGPEHFCCSW